MALEWNVANMGSISVEDSFRIETATSQYFLSLLQEDSHSAFQEPNEALETIVTIQTQSFNDNVTIVESLIEVIHAGDQGIVDLAALLMFLTNKNTTNSTNRTYIVDRKRCLISR